VKITSYGKEVFYVITSVAPKSLVGPYSDRLLLTIDGVGLCTQGDIKIRPASRDILY
jgi:hypothetical protein